MFGNQDHSQILALIGQGQAPQHPGHRGPLSGVRNFLGGRGLIGHLMRARQQRQGDPTGQPAPGVVPGRGPFGGPLGRFMDGRQQQNPAQGGFAPPRFGQGGQLRPQGRPDRSNGIPPREASGPMSAANDHGRALYAREAARAQKNQGGRWDR